MTAKTRKNFEIYMSSIQQVKRCESQNQFHINFYQKQVPNLINSSGIGKYYYNWNSLGRGMVYKDLLILIYIEYGSIRYKKHEFIILCKRMNDISGGILLYTLSSVHYHLPCL